MSSILLDQSSNQLLASLPQMINTLKAENKVVGVGGMDTSNDNNQKKESTDNVAALVVASKCECEGYSTETMFLIVFVVICIVLSLVWIVSGFMDSKSDVGSNATNE
jgi:hypothetical protein